METIVNGVWSWHQMPEDLRQQAGYEGININPLSVRPASCTGSTVEGNRFMITWRPALLMMLSLLRDEQALIDAFATVVEYRPFCKYRHRTTEQLITYEWDKKDPEGRLAELQQDADIIDLQPIGEL